MAQLISTVGAKQWAAGMRFDAEIELIRGEVEATLASLKGDTGFAALVRRPLNQPGKILGEGVPRWPILVLLVCEAICGDYVRASPAAAAMEFFIAAGDVFDDVEDRDSPKALWCVCGDAQAINVATALLMLTQQAITRLRERAVEASRILCVTQAISHAGVMACAGQHSDLLHDSREHVSEAAYLRAVRRKSGSLTECACRVGAVLATDNERTISAYSSFGSNLGVAAQLTNDALSLSPSRGAKSEIRARKKTLPVIYGLANSESEDHQLLVEVYLRGVAVTQDKERQVAQVLTALGAVHYALVLAEVYKLRAARALRDSGVAEHSRLRAFCDM